MKFYDHAAAQIQRTDRVRSANRPCWIVAGALFFACLGTAADFEKEVLPIFEENCLDCHGESKQKGDFRVDKLWSLLKGGDSGERAVIPGEPAESFLVKAIRHNEADYEMPPKGEPLSESEISTIEKWISEGAKVPESWGPAEKAIELTHWSFLPLKRPAGKGVDDFVSAKLSENGLSFSRRADRRTLVRRIFLVMLGLPPTPEQVEEFLNDESEGAWDNLIEAVLASPHYGERWATHWLDLVRFGETHGFEMNRERPNAWRFRDWVIESFNTDKPYDQFVRDQIAGDAFGTGIGTGFLVAGPFDAVKGKDPKLRQMQRMNELDDMINTTGTAFLGLTLGCARCHNHKFDPVTQADYYSLQAVFAGVDHGDRNLPRGAEQNAELANLDSKISTLRKELEPFVRKPGGAMVVMDDSEATPLIPAAGKGKHPSGTDRGFADDRLFPNLGGGQYTWWKNEPGKEIVRWLPELEGRYRVWISWGAGYASHSGDAEYFLQGESHGRKLIARVNQQKFADGSGEVISKALWSGFKNGGIHQFAPGDSLVLVGGKSGSAVTADAVMFEPVSSSIGGENEPTYPGIRPPVNARLNREIFAPVDAKFVRFSIQKTNNGSQACIDELEVFSGNENVALAAAGAKATSSGDFKHPIHRLAHINDGAYGNERSWILGSQTGWVQIEFDRIRKIDRIEWGRDRTEKFKDRVATDYTIQVATQSGNWRTIAGSKDRLQFQRGDIRSYAGLQYDFQSGSDEGRSKDGRALYSELEKLVNEREELARPEQIYAGKFSQPGPTHRLYRGEPELKREEVGPNAIAVFTSLDLERNAPEVERRVALAEWIGSSTNPLTARVIVNRLWQFHFGTGIVDTPSDFGRNGAAPSHPELLDWLAAELIENNWSLKHIHRLILTSTTWQQSNRPRSQAMEIDAGSRMLWRFPPRRLEAEGIRDSILSVTGAIDLESRGGPGFSPFKVEMENVRHYHPKENYGPEDWRRMIYMTKVRQEREQVFGAFDCPDASQAVAKRSRSTTPLQALNLLNSKFVMQQAGILAGRLEKENKDRETQIRRAWELCFNRPAEDADVRDSADFIQKEGMVQFCRALLNANEFVFIP